MSAAHIPVEEQPAAVEEQPAAATGMPTPAVVSVPAPEQAQTEEEKEA